MGTRKVDAQQWSAESARRADRRSWPGVSSPFLLLLDTKYPRGLAALMLASLNGRLDTVRMLLAAGADVNASDPGGLTPRMIAPLRGHSKIVRLLIAAEPEK